jgi:hypothetical protein
VVGVALELPGRLSLSVSALRGTVPEVVKLSV